MPLPLLAVAALATAAYKGIKGFQEKQEADELAKRDTEPIAHKETVALARQAAAAGLPGAGAYLNRIEAGTNDTLSAATRAGTSSDSVLGLLQTSDMNRTRALSDLATREDANHQQQLLRLEGVLNQQGRYQLADQQELDKNKAALNQAGDTNMYNGFNEGAQAVTALVKDAKNGDGDDDAADEASGLSPAKSKSKLRLMYEPSMPLRIQGYN